MLAFLILLGLFFFLNGFYWSVLFALLGQLIAGEWGAVIGWFIGFYLDSYNGTIK
jgi:hypothetical protein